MKNSTALFNELKNEIRAELLSEIKSELVSKGEAIRVQRANTENEDERMLLLGKQRGIEDARWIVDMMY